LEKKTKPSYYKQNDTFFRNFALEILFRSVQIHGCYFKILGDHLSRTHQI